MLFMSKRFLLVAAVLLIPAVRASAQGNVKMTGIHANEPFCKTTMKQYEVSMAYMRSSIGHAPDPKAREKFFNDQRAINAILLTQAPASLKSDITLINKDANASFDAQLHADQRHMLAAMAPLRSPEHLAAAKRVNAYCGVVPVR
jgi:hypothetical protein